MRWRSMLVVAVAVAYLLLIITITTMDEPTLAIIDQRTIPEFVRR